jgi:hypothetical protein
VGRRENHEEDIRAALDDPNKAGAAEALDGFTAPTSSGRAPVAELVDAHGLQPCDQSGRPSPSLGWGTTFNPVCDSNT